MSTPTAAWDAPTLVESLGRAGWLDLDGRAGGGLRTTLHALVSLLPHGSAEGKVTAAQVADAGGLSVKWARHCLARLEDLGLISWRRGSIIDGKPQPGWVRIIKTALARLVRRARGYLDDRRTDRQTATRVRLSKLRSTYIFNHKRRNPLSVRAELSSPLPFLKGGTTPVPSQLTATRFHKGDELMPTNQLGTPCIVCGRTPERCEHANRVVPADQRHRYQASRPRSHQLVAPLTKPQDSRPAPQGWRNRHHQDALIEGSHGDHS